jgi:hypothetical protein
VPYDYKPPTRIGADNFVERVRQDGILVILRQTMGQVTIKSNYIQDIASACGQLVVNEQKGCGDGGLADMEDFGGSETKERKVKLDKRRRESRLRKVSSSELIAAQQPVIPHRKDFSEVYWRLGVPALTGFFVLVLVYRVLNRMILIE